MFSDHFLLIHLFRFSNVVMMTVKGPGEWNTPRSLSMGSDCHQVSVLATRLNSSAEHTPALYCESLSYCVSHTSVQCCKCGDMPVRKHSTNGEHHTSSLDINTHSLSFALGFCVGDTKNENYLLLSRNTLSP